MCSQAGGDHGTAAAVCVVKSLVGVKSSVHCEVCGGRSGGEGGGQDKAGFVVSLTEWDVEGRQDGLVSLRLAAVAACLVLGGWPVGCAVSGRYSPQVLRGRPQPLCG